MCNNSLRKCCLVAVSLLVAILGFAQETRTITGTVVDASGEPLIGAGVVVVSQPTIGTITDFDGHYSLQVPADALQLRFSYIGMVDAVMAIADHSGNGRTLTGKKFVSQMNYPETDVEWLDGTLPF